MKWTKKEIIFTLFALLWIIIVIIDYWNKHPIYTYDFYYFKYPLLVLGLIAYGFILVPYAQGRWNKALPSMLQLNGLTSYLLWLPPLIFMAFQYNQNLKFDLSISNYWHLVTSASYVLMAGALILFSMNILGRLALIYSRLTPKLGGITSFLAQTSIGFFIFHIVLFAVAYLGLLTTWVVWPLLLLPIIADYKYALKTIKSWLITPLEFPRRWRWKEYTLLYVLFLLFTINIFYVLSPYPIGFDARNYYVNIANLLYQNESIVKGFQPYAWGLIESIGLTAFLRIEVTLFLTVIGGYLSCLALYELCIRYLRQSSFYALLGGLVLLVTPAVSNQLLIEHKIDLALMYIQLTILCLLFNWIIENNRDRIHIKWQKIDYTYLTIISILLAFCMAIKALTVFLIVGIASVIWWKGRDHWGGLGLAILCIGIFIIIGLDDRSGVRAYHDNPSRSGLIISFVALGLILYGLYKQGFRSALYRLKPLLLMALIILLGYSPWIMKNYSDHPGKIGITEMILGTNPRLHLDVNQMIKNYENQK